MNEKVFARVKAGKIRFSKILPERNHGNDIRNSVKRWGIQQPLIVRPIANSDEYEIVDGQGRLEAFSPEEEVLVEIRKNLTDTDVFRICEATFKRTGRNTCEKSAFYAAYLEIMKKTADQNRAQSRVAEDSNISESLLSQYLAINNMFVKLTELNPEAKFNKLKCMGINKLYELARLADSPQLVEAAIKVEGASDSISAEEIREIVQSFLHDEPSDIQKALEEAEPQTSPIENEPQSVKMEKEIRRISEKLAPMIQKLKETLSQISQQKNFGTEKASIGTLNCLQRISADVQRISRHFRKLETALCECPPEPPTTN